MNRNAPSVILIVTFVLRIVMPIGNAVYFLSEILHGNSDLWFTLFIVSLSLEAGVVIMLAMGLNDPCYRRIGAYITLVLPVLHYAVIMASVILLPAARRFITPVYPVVLTVACAVTVALGYMTLRSADGMFPSERKALPANEIDACVKSLHDKLNGTP